MRYTGGYSFETSFTWQEMLARLKRVASWDEWWSVTAGDILISIAATNVWEGHHEKATILWDKEVARWRLVVAYESGVRDVEERWQRFVTFVCETLVVVDAAAIEKLASFTPPPVHDVDR